DGKRVLSGSYDKTARLWDAASGEVVHPRAGHRDSVYAVAFLHDRERALTASADGSLGLWDTKTGRLLCELFSFADGSGAVIDPEGRFDGPASRCGIRRWRRRTGTGK